jgi:hypothetical protein
MGDGSAVLGPLRQFFYILRPPESSGAEARGIRLLKMQSGPFYPSYQDQDIAVYCRQ